MATTVQMLDRHKLTMAASPVTLFGFVTLASSAQMAPLTQDQRSAQRVTDALRTEPPATQMTIQSIQSLLTLVSSVTVPLASIKIEREAQSVSHAQLVTLAPTLQRQSVSHKTSLPHTTA